MRWIGRIAIAAMLAGLGCTAGPEGSGAAMGPAAGSFGVLQIERSALDDMPELSGRRAVLNAVFARYRGMTGEDALELLGVARPGPDLDDCAIVGSPPVLWPGADAAVELMDVGALEVTVAGSRAELRARTFPELGTLVAGAFYAEHAELAQARADQDEYRVAARGSLRSAPFEVVLVAPPGPAEVVVDSLSDVEVPVARRDRDLELLWDAGDPRDRLDVQLLAGGQVLECAVRDDGFARLPADLLGQLEADDDARLVLRRVRVQGFDAPGLDVAWADLTATRTIPLVVQ
jgi:hypothetical protein